MLETILNDDENGLISEGQSEDELEHQLEHESEDGLEHEIKELENNKPGKTKRFFRGLKKFLGGLGKSLVAGFLLLHLGTSAAFYTNEVAARITPNKIQRIFQQTHGMPILGYESDVQKFLSTIGISRVIEREKAEMPFNVPNIRVSSSNYLMQSPFDQIVTLFLTPYAGLACPWSYEIVVKPEANEATLTHEIKHIKTFQVLEKYPEFRKKWEDLAKDENGNSLYLSNSEQAISRTRLIHTLVDAKYSNSKENRKLGFVTNYARTNFYEDVAEVCGQIEAYSCSPVTLISSFDYTNSSLMAKISLAREYGLLPKELIDYLNLIRVFDTVEFLKTRDQSERVWSEKIFLDNSALFISENPKSVYSCSVRNMRANILIYMPDNTSVDIKTFQYMDKLNAKWQDSSLSRDEREKCADKLTELERAMIRGNRAIHEQNLKAALRETDSALLADYKDPVAYATALGISERICRDLGYYLRAVRLAEASTLFLERLGQNDPLITRRGVNDDLFNQGVLSRN